MEGRGSHKDFNTHELLPTSTAHVALKVFFPLTLSGSCFLTSHTPDSAAGSSLCDSASCLIPYVVSSILRRSWSRRRVRICCACSGCCAIALAVPDIPGPIVTCCRNRVPLPSGSSSKRHWALGCAGSLTFQASTQGGSQVTMYDVVSHSLPPSCRFLPTKAVPTRGLSVLIQVAPRNSVLKRAGRLISLTNSQTRVGVAAMSTSTVTPGPAASRERPSRGCALVSPQRSNQVMAEAGRRVAGVKSVPCV